jgi:hypothetical protein
LRCKARIISTDPLVNPRHYFSKNISNTFVKFVTFTLSSDKKTLIFDAKVKNAISEVVFDTVVPEATVTFDIQVKSSSKQAGLFLGEGNRVSSNKAIALSQFDKRVKGAPENYVRTPTGLYLRAVRPLSETMPKTELSDEAIQKLKSLGYIE